MTVLDRTVADCEGRPVIISPADDDQCLQPPVNQTVRSIHAYNLRVVARSKDVYTRLNYRFTSQHRCNATRYVYTDNCRGLTFSFL